ARAEWTLAIVLTVEKGACPRKQTRCRAPFRGRQHPQDRGMSARPAPPPGARKTPLKHLRNSPQQVQKMPVPRASRALERFTILDLTQVRSGPTCVRQLAAWGANVIKIEQPPALAVAALTAGLFCAIGILLALLEREKSKKGQHVATSLLQAQIFMLDFQAARWLVNGEVAPQAGNNHPTSMPTGVYKTADGHINI